MIFNFEDWKDKKVCMWCKTENEAKEFCNAMHTKGLTWCSERSYNQATNWDIFCEHTVYYFNDGYFGDMFATDDDCVILNWNDYSGCDFSLKPTVKVKPLCDTADKSTYELAIEDMITYCSDTLISKHQEYATEDDFHNFNVAAKLQDVTPEQALIGMMAKHVVSVYDLVNAAAEGRTVPEDLWREKIGDNINYLLILWAMVTRTER